MWIAKKLDKKKGEALVVDKRQVLRETLSKWLAERPTVEELSERGILGRGVRFSAARETLERFFLLQFQKKEEEAVRIPPGNFQYNSSVLELLGGSTSSSLAAKRLEELRGELQGAEQRVQDSATAWGEAALECDRCMRLDTLKQVGDGTGRVLELLKEHRSSTGSALEELNEQLRELQRCLTRKSCIEAVSALHEQTDAVREAVFAWTTVDTLPLSVLEGIPKLCSELPPRTRMIGIKRLKFLIPPIRTAFTQALHAELKKTGRWPTTDQAKMSLDQSPSLGERAIRLCADLIRVQRVDQERSKLERSLGSSAKQKVEHGKDADLWVFSVLMSSLAARFRHHFCRSSSATCKLDKPDWAFRYLHDLAKDHSSLLASWVDGAYGTGKLSTEQTEALSGVDFATGLTVQAAAEGRLFVRGRASVLAHPEMRPVWLHTLLHLVQIRAQFCELCPVSGQELFADFDENRFIQLAKNPDAISDPASPSGVKAGSGIRFLAGAAKSVAGTAASGLSEFAHEAQSMASGKAEPSNSNSLMAGLSHLQGTQADAVPASAAAADAELTEQLPEAGMLDLWIEADADFIREKVEGVVANGSAWRPRPLLLEALDGADAPSNIAKLQVEIAELVRVVSNLFEKSAERMECLSAESARKAFGDRVLQEGLRCVISAIKERWNASENVLGDIGRAALLIETLEEICIYFDQVFFGAYLVGAVDEINTLRLGMLDKVVCELVDAVQSNVRRLRTEPGLMSMALGPSLQAMSNRVRPSNFQIMMQKCSTQVAELLMSHLLRRVVSFADADEMAFFARNCRDDLQAVLEPWLDGEGMAVLTPLQEGCDLLLLPEETATHAVTTLRRIAKLAPSDFLGEGPGGPSPDSPAVEGKSDLLRKKQAEVFMELGVTCLSAADAVTVLSKRPEFFGKLADLQEMHAAAQLIGSVAQAATAAAQDTLQQLGSGLAGSALKAASSATLRTGVGALREGLEMGNRLAAPDTLKGNLKRGLKGAAGVGAGVASSAAGLARGLQDAASLASVGARALSG